MALSILVGSGLVGNGKRGEELREGHDGTELVDLSFSPSSQSVRSSGSFRRPWCLGLDTVATGCIPVLDGISLSRALKT